MGRIQKGTKTDIQRAMECRGCKYAAVLRSNLIVCDYLSIEKKRRPCPPGSECTVRVREPNIRVYEQKYDHNAIYAMLKEGKKAREIADKIGCSPQLVWKLQHHLLASEENKKEEQKNAEIGIDG